MEKMTAEVIDLANDKKFSEFSKKVKTMLNDKIRSNPDLKDKLNKIDKFNHMKDEFEKALDEPKVKVEPTEPETPEPEVKVEPTEPKTPEPEVKVEPTEPEPETT